MIIGEEWEETGGEGEIDLFPRLFRLYPRCSFLRLFHRQLSCWVQSFSTCIKTNPGWVSVTMDPLITKAFTLFDNKNTATQFLHYLTVTIPFLDILIKWHNHTFSTSLYRKKTFTGYNELQCQHATEDQRWTDRVNNPLIVVVKRQQTLSQWLMICHRQWHYSISTKVTCVLNQSLTMTSI